MGSVDPNKHDMKNFNIHSTDHEHGIKTVPMKIVEPARGRIYDNHSQTLERVNERGGLSLRELLAAITGLDFTRVTSDPETLVKAVNALIEI